MVSQKKIAEALGLSIMTVSRGLRNHPDLAEETKARIIRKAQEFGYIQRHSNTRETNITRRVGVYTYHLVDQPSGESATQRNILPEIELVCRKKHIELIHETLPTGETPMSMQRRSVEAAFLFGRYTREDALKFRNVPTLALSSYIENGPVPCITADNLGGMRAATEHLISFGHRRILFLGWDEFPFTQIFRRRCDGYKLAMIDHDLEPKTRFVRMDELTADSIRELLKDFTAVVCSGDYYAYHLQKLLLQSGYKLPHDCSLVGFDSFEGVGAQDITSYAPDWNAIGAIAANLVLNRGREWLDQPFRVIAPGQLVVRSSTAAV